MSTLPTVPTFTGTQVKYYQFCKRRLWLFSHGVEMERENEDVQTGTLIGEQTYKREQKEIAIDDRIVIDWAEHKVNPDGSLTLHEVKKSRSFDAAHRLQMLYYLFYLKCKGVVARGQIDYPLLKKIEIVELTPQSEAELKEVLADIERIVESNETPPRLTNKRLCEKCSYFELCWS
jgi:CRISPR-associated exonuclease Cas4